MHTVSLGGSLLGEALNSDSTTKNFRESCTSNFGKLCTTTPQLGPVSRKTALSLHNQGSPNSAMS